MSRNGNSEVLNAATSITPSSAGGAATVGLVIIPATVQAPTAIAEVSPVSRNAPPPNPGLSINLPPVSAAPIQSPSVGQPSLPGAVESPSVNSQANMSSAAAVSGAGLFSPSAQQRIDSIDRHLDDAGLTPSNNSDDDYCSCCC